MILGGGGIVNNLHLWTKFFLMKIVFKLTPKINHKVDADDVAVDATVSPYLACHWPQLRMSLDGTPDVADD